GANTLTVTAASATDTATVVRRVTFGARNDNDVFWDGLLHDSRNPLYRTPVGPVPAGTPVTLRLRAYAGDLTGVSVRIWDSSPHPQAPTPPPTPRGGGGGGGGGGPPGGGG
ncbi:MAG: hypothetical protein N0A03_10610, partial [Anaerolineae bacterium]|nr:hypothetical protein [Anaerolineae bacterium]